MNRKLLRDLVKEYRKKEQQKIKLFGRHQRRVQYKERTEEKKTGNGFQILD